MQHGNLAARIGKWSAQHRRKAILGWIAFVVLAVVVGGKVGLNDLDDSATGSGESKRGDLIVAAAGFPDQSGEQVLVQSETAGDPRLAATAGDVATRLAKIEGVTDVDEPLRSADGRSVLVNFALEGTDEQVEKLVEQPLAAVAAVQKAHPGVRVEQFGEVSAMKAIAGAGRQGRQARGADLHRAAADHPARRVRRRRGRRPPARARRQRRRGRRSACSGRSAGSTRCRPTSPTSW